MFFTVTTFSLNRYYSCKTKYVYISPRILYMIKEVSRQEAACTEKYTRSLGTLGSEVVFIR